MRKIGLIVQRYGLEVNGGAELHCRQWAEKLKDYFEVEVFTTQAMDYVTWEAYYPEGVCEVNGIKVHRFPLAHERDPEEFNEIYGRVASQPEVSRELELEWMEKQGPACPALVEYLKEHEAEYDAFVFFTYLYYTSFHGLLAVKDKAILIPEAHDERPIYLGIFRDLFKAPKALFYNTTEEKDFVEQLFKVADIPNNGGHGGAGVEVPEHVDAEAFKKKYNVDDYIIYVGRIDESKGCKELFDYFREYKAAHPGNTKLVLLGKSVMEIPEDEDIIPLGFVSEEDKFNGIAGAKLLVLPSHFESLSLVVLEAFSLGRPVLVSGLCSVLKGHCDKSQAGFYFTDYEEFEEKLTTMLSDEALCSDMGVKGSGYVKNYFSWDAIIGNFIRLFEQVFGKE